MLVGLLVAVAIPLTELVDNWRSHDASGRYFARDFAFNLLNALPPNAILFTVGDNDTYPPLYLQAAEHARTDVRVVNLSVLNMPYFPERLLKLDPDFPLSILTVQRARVLLEPWTDSLVSIPVTAPPASFGLDAQSLVLSSVELNVRPMTGMTRLLEQDASLLDIVKKNVWRRPLTFSITGGSSSMQWLEQYGEAKGLFYRIVPILHPAPDARAIVWDLIGKSLFTGYADPAVVVDDVSNRIGLLYYQAFSDVLRGARVGVTKDECMMASQKLQKAVPLSRLVVAEFEGTPGVTCN